MKSTNEELDVNKHKVERKRNRRKKTVCVFVCVCATSNDKVEENEIDYRRAEQDKEQKVQNCIVLFFPHTRSQNQLFLCYYSSLDNFSLQIKITISFFVTIVPHSLIPPRFTIITHLLCLCIVFTSLHDTLSLAVMYMHVTKLINSPRKYV